MKISKYYFIVNICFLFLMVSCKEEGNKKIETATITFQKEGTLSIRNVKTDSASIKIDIEIAESPYEIQTGLMYRDTMEEKEGMLFIFQEMSMHSFYMKNTKIALDLIFIDDQLKIASIHKNAKPMDESPLPSKVPVQYVLEINAGLADKWSLEIGDSITYAK
ncbi:MAG: DUF192 domain-containing protein [Cellulophaga sp.]